MSKWQSIKTAPQRKLVLVMTEGGSQKILYLADNEGVGKNDWRNSNGTASGIWPIAWQHLPSVSLEEKTHFLNLAFTKGLLV